MTDIDIKTDVNGLHYYENPPPTFELAQSEDFFNKIAVYDYYDDFMEFKLVLKEDFAFLVKSFHSELFQAYRVKEDFNPEVLAPWIDDDRVYIWKNDH